MSACDKPRVLFVPGHMCDERLYGAQVAALGPEFDCQVMVFRLPAGWPRTTPPMPP